VDGVIVLPTAETAGFDHFRPYIEKKIPLVFLDRAARLPQVSSVVIDNRDCGYTVTRHLIGQGCRRIVHLTPSVEQEIYAERYKGYRDALVESGLKAEKALLQLSPLSEDAFEAADKRILSMKPLPDGVFATNDLAAAVCVRMFQENKLRVPQDIAVVGFNDDVIGPAGQAPADDRALTIRADLIVRASSLKKGGPPG
jgi:LacI family transcriptional regulator